MKKQRTPQEKKALSYRKDCRNCYSENDKASRKAIPLWKAKVNRGYRRHVNQKLNQVYDSEPENGELVDYKVRALVRRHWTKSPDEPLAQQVWRKLKRRYRLGINIVLPKNSQ